MSSPITHTRIAIIGGGIVGVSTAYHLALKGQADVMVLERAELTSGSTWHAAGNLPHFHGSYNMIRMQQYGKSLYRQLEKDTGQPVGLHWTGALRLAHTDQRVDEFERVAAMGRSLGLDMRMIDAAEAKQLHPFLDTSGLRGLLWDPVDGHVDPTSLTNALAGEARKRGVTFKRNSPVLGITRGASGQWQLETAAGAIEAASFCAATSTDLVCTRPCGSKHTSASGWNSWAAPSPGQRCPTNGCNSTLQARWSSSSRHHGATAPRTW